MPRAHRRVMAEHRDQALNLTPAAKGDVIAQIAAFPRVRSGGIAGRFAMRVEQMLCLHRRRPVNVQGRVQVKIVGTHKHLSLGARNAPRERWFYIAGVNIPFAKMVNAAGVMQLPSCRLDIVTY